LARCNFEKDLCTWKQQADDEFDWSRRKGQTPSFSTGPSRDHTLGTLAGRHWVKKKMQSEHGLIIPVNAVRKTDIVDGFLCNGKGRV